MGKGDNKTRRGKIANHSFGKLRPNKSAIRKLKRDKDEMSVSD